MAADEGFDDDGPEFLPPLPPEDRVWRHPAEMGAAAHAAAPTPRPTGRSPWTVGFVSVIGGVLLASSLMFGAGGMGDEPSRIALQPIATLEPRSTTDSDDGADPVGLDTVSPPAALVGIDVDTGTDVRSGNGLVVAPDGVVVTTASLIAGAADIRVTDELGNPHAAVVAGVDALNDLAVLRVSGLTRAPTVLDPAARAVVDEPVRVFGASRGVAYPSWTAVVADDDARLTDGDTDLHGALQLDHAIDGSAAGAPAQRADGTVVGIVTTLGADGPTHVIPNRTIASVATQIITTGVVRHGWLGVEGVTANDPDGAHVRRVVDGSPAQLAGVAQEDVVVSFDGEAIESMGDLVVAVREHSPGATVTIGVTREGTRLDFAVTLVDSPAA